MTKFCASVGVRAGVLPTRLRCARGYPDSTIWCDHCGPSVPRETLGHILQVCPRTHGARIKRHDRIVQELGKMLGKKGYQISFEPIYRTSAGVKKPDIVIWGPGKPSVVLDVSVVADNCGNLDDPHFAKIQKYEVPELAECVRVATGVAPDFSAFVVNWRGCLAPQSAADALNWGLSKSQLGMLTNIVVEQGAIIHRQFMTSTSRSGGWTVRA